MKNCSVCIMDYEGKETCQLCKEGFVMTRRGCKRLNQKIKEETVQTYLLKRDNNTVDEESHCDKRDPITTKCIECSKGYYLDEEKYCNQIELCRAGQQASDKLPKIFFDKNKTMLRFLR